MALQVGIDVGGTKTHIGVYDRQGMKMHDFWGSGANLANDKEAAIRIVDEVLAAALAEVTPQAVDKIAIGMAGVLEHPLLPQFVDTLEHKYRAQVMVYNDVVFAHKAIFRNRPGLLLSAGTGSIAVVRGADAAYRMIGGYGHLFGDEASGYDIAKRALIYCTQQADFGQHDALTAAILQALGCATIRAAIPRLYRMNKAEIAALAQVVAALAEQGDAVATEILRASSAEYLHHIIETLQRLKIQPQQYAFWGSVLQNNSYMQLYIRQHLEQVFACTLIDTGQVDITCAVTFE